MYVINTSKSKEENTYLSILLKPFFFDHLLYILRSFKPAYVRTVLSDPITLFFEVTHQFLFMSLPIYLFNIFTLQLIYGHNSQ